MILHRLASAIRHQNLSQIITEILIVVIGIFLGLQVTDWAENRTLRDQEKAYLHQLHEEVYVLDNRVVSFLSSENKELENLFILTNYFADNLEVEELTMEHCTTIRSSHILTNPALAIPTVTELLSSGQLTIFSDKELINLISRYTSRLDRASQTHARMSVRAEHIPSKFQDLVEIAPVTEFPGYIVDKLYLHCDFEAMKENKQFKTALIFNHFRQATNVNIVKDQYSILHDLHLKLDDLLHLLHDDETD